MDPLEAEFAGFERAAWSVAASISAEANRIGLESARIALYLLRNAQSQPAESGPQTAASSPGLLLLPVLVALEALEDCQKLGCFRLAIDHGDRSFRLRLARALQESGGFSPRPARKGGVRRSQYGV